jgi:hypothetical protein
MACKLWQADFTDAPPSAISSDGLLDSKKRTKHHPLIHGAPMCDEVHEIPELPVTPVPTVAQSRT